MMKFSAILSLLPLLPAGAIGDDCRVTQALKNGAPVDGLDAAGDTALVR
jgi:hypothetical protein